MHNQIKKICAFLNHKYNPKIIVSVFFEDYLFEKAY